MKELFKKVREELKAHYVPLVADERNNTRNYSGTGEGCCVWGAICRVGPASYTDRDLMLQKLDTIALKMFPELKGKQTLRSQSEPLKSFPGGSQDLGHGEDFPDRFDPFPAVYVNNHLGKEAILKVVSRAIKNSK